MTANLFGFCEFGASAPVMKMFSRNRSEKLSIVNPAPGADSGTYEPLVRAPKSSRKGPGLKITATPEVRPGTSANTGAPLSMPIEMLAVPTSAPSLVAVNVPVMVLVVYMS